MLLAFIDEIIDIQIKVRWARRALTELPDKIASARAVDDIVGLAKLVNHLPRLLAVLLVEDVDVADCVEILSGKDVAIVYDNSCRRW